MTSLEAQWTTRTAPGQERGWHIFDPTTVDATGVIAEIRDSFDNAAKMAHLFAAAPELLDALKKIAAKIDKASGSPTFTAEEHWELEDIIKKAEGRE